MKTLPTSLGCWFVAGTVLVTPTFMAHAGMAALDNRVATVMNIPGVVAFWDFVKREPDGDRRFAAHVPAGALNEFPLDAGNYVAEYWGQGSPASYADFPLLGRGPFGNAIRIRRESDPTFRPYTRIEVVTRKGPDGQFTERARDLVGLRLNPWWFPHDLYSPPDDGTGGPFTIGRVIHSSRSVGFTGWIGGVAVFDRALTAAELQRLAALCQLPPIHQP